MVKHLLIHKIPEQRPVLHEILDRGQLALVGGMYNLSTGRFDFYPQ
jgi:hypothetical protein